MTIARDQISEILDVVQRYVPADKIGPLLAELRSCQAAQRNKSFADTTWRLLEAWMEQYPANAEDRSLLSKAGYGNDGDRNDLQDH